MTTSWDRQSGETEEWYDRFRLYLYMGPDRTIAAAHAFATRLAKGLSTLNSAVGGGQPSAINGKRARLTSMPRCAARRWRVTNG